MKEKICIMGAVALLFMHQTIDVSSASALQIKTDKELISESFDYDEIYPVDSDDKVWEKLETDEMKFEKAQIKPSIIEKMNTETLLEAVIKNPMISRIEEYGDGESGVMEFLEHLNAGKQLLRREDIKEEIIKEYLSLQIPERALNDYSALHSGGSLDSTLTELLKDKEFSENLDKDIDIYYRIHFLEGIILSDEIYPSLTAAEKMQLYNKSLQLNKEKENSEIFSYSPEASFTYALLNDSDLMMNNILTKSAAAEEYSVVYIKTPKGSSVAAKKYANNHVNSDAYVSAFKAQHSDKHVVGHGYYWSNCHAYSWACNPNVWLDNASYFVTDGSYKKISANRPTSNYQRVYKGDQHSAIVVNVQGTPRIQTKSNHSPVYECDIDVDFPGGYTIYQYNSVC